jgi:PTH1 family peptidyl-tRNA hydrolase
LGGVNLVVGLGNPGERYARTRHNVGVRVLERFGLDHGIALDQARFDGRFGRGAVTTADAEPHDVALLAPDTYMNRSGEAVARALDGLGIDAVEERLIVVFDDADLPFGRIRIRPRGSSGGHNGLASVIQWVAGSDFARLRFGIGRPPTASPGAGEEAARDARGGTIDWVLDRFSEPEERVLVDRIPAAAQALAQMVGGDVTGAMNRYNRDPEAESAS